MATQSKIIGRVPVSRLEYVEGMTSFKDNIVTRYASAFQCTVDSTTTPPATLNSDNEIVLGEGWIFFADASAARRADKRINETNAAHDKTASEVTALIADLQEVPDFAEIRLCGQPVKLFGHGAPSADHVPDNWIQMKDGGYDWNGVPSALGQEYINVDSSTGGHYIAIRDSAMKLKWYNC